MTAVPVRVVGVRKAAAMYPWALLALAGDLHPDAAAPVAAVGLWDDPTPPSLEDRLPVRLVREPGNPVDRNAIQVLVPVLLERHRHHPHVGWIPADIAVEYAKRMKAGLTPTAWVGRVPIGSPADMRPGLIIWVDWPHTLNSFV